MRCHLYLVLETLLVIRLQRVTNDTRLLLVLEPFPVFYVALYISIRGIVRVNWQKVSGLAYLEINNLLEPLLS